MGLLCSKSKEAEHASQLRSARHALDRRRSSDTYSRRPPFATVESLMAHAINSVVDTLHQQPRQKLLNLPTDVSQLLLEECIHRGRLDSSTVPHLSGLHFYRVNLSNFPVTDDWLAHLITCSLETLNLKRTDITDAGIIHSCARLPHLRSIILDNDSGLTDLGLSIVPTLPSLQHLSLAGCEKITSQAIRWISCTPNLRSLDLQRCVALSELEPLHTLTHLTSLNLGWCIKILDSDVSVLPQLHQLKELHLCHTHITGHGVLCLQPLSQLTYLSLGGSVADDRAIACAVGNMPHLIELSLERCSNAGDAVLEALCKTSVQLRRLDVSYCLGLTDIGLSHMQHLKQLERLTLDACDNISDRGMAVIEFLKGLVYLDISDTRAGATSMRYIRKLRKLHTLNMSFTEVADEGLENLTRLTSLRRLHLDCRQITDAGLAHICQLNRLEVLDMFSARISDLGCLRLGESLTELTNLELCGGQITDVGVSRLCSSLINLRHLNLGMNSGITNASIPPLLALTGLQSLNLSECRISGTAVFSLCSLKNLDLLSLHDTAVKPLVIERLMTANRELRVVGVHPPLSSLLN